MSEQSIIVEQLYKRYGNFTAVNGVSFQVEAGEIFGFLGPNGAGKSTVVKILTTLALPSAGRATVGSYDIATHPEQVRTVAGVALQEIGLDPMMKSMELLTIQGQVFGMSRSQARKRGEELLALVKLEKFTDRLVGQYSGGMRRRLDLALALVHEPQILFLDEPTTGLDPASRRDVWNEVYRLNRELGMTIFLTTQYLEEADELADRIAIIDGGNIVAEGTPEALKAALGGESINITLRDGDAVQQAKTAIEGMDIVQRLQIDRNTVRLYLPGAARAVPSVVAGLQAARIELVSLTLTQPTLDDVFLQVTGQRYDAEPAAEPTIA